MNSPQQAHSTHCRYISVIPAYNPGPAVIDVVRKALEHCAGVILVDDGCDCENKNYLDECGRMEHVKLIRFNANRGKGHALMAGLTEALGNGPDYLFTIDSDGQHDPKELVRFKRAIETSNEPYDLIIGTRAAMAAMPLRSRIGNAFTAKLFYAIFGRPVFDTQSGYRVLSADFATDVIANVAAGRFETEMKMLIRAVETRRNIFNLGIETLYIDENRNSKFRPLHDSMRVLVPLSKYAAVASGSFLIDYSMFLLLTYAAGVPYLLAHAIARTCSGVSNFFANKYLVFGSRSRTIPEVFRYFGAVITAMLVAALLLYGMIELLAVPMVWAKLIAEFIVFLINFFMLKRIVFSGEQTHRWS